MERVKKVRKSTILYAGVYSNYDGCRVFRYDGGITWTQVNNPGFGDNNNDPPLSMISWNGYLWVGTENTSTGTEIWKYDGTTWSQANVDGFGSYDTRAICNLTAYNGRLYAGGSSHSTNAKVFRYDNGTSWSRIDSGTVASIEGTAWSMASYSGKLFTGIAANGGCQVWSYNGSSWAQESSAGFGDANNTQASAMAVFGNRLYVGTTGATAQVWMTDGSPAPESTTVYLAEGSTDWGYSCYISIENPNAEPVEVKLTYQTKSGPVSGPQFAMAAQSQATVNPRDTVGNTDFSTKVECTDGKIIAADRTMIWNAGQGEEAHCSVGVTGPSSTWYLPEGSSDWGFECWLLIQNPNANAANCQITYMIENENPVTVSKTVPANSRATFNMADDIGQKDASIKVTSDQPVIPERAMYRNNKREGHDSIGTTTPATDYYLAEGATGYDVGYVTFILVQNPQDSPTNVSLTYMTQTGQVAGPSFQMPANSRKTIRVNDQLPPNTDVSTKVSGSAPIIAERAMYWDNGTGEACHDSIGMAEPHTTFYLPDGQTSDGRETWTLVQNPNAEDVTVTITYMTPDGAGNVNWDEVIPANSRRTFNMADKGINGRAAIMVVSKGSPVMVERAMYWNNRGAGTDTIGGYKD